MLGGTIVFRQVGNRTIVATAPGRSGEISQKQKAQRQRFQEAVVYAKAQMQDPTAKSEYTALTNEENGNAYSIAVADFLNAPNINLVDMSNYTGKIGDSIRIQVTDDFKVMQVSVRIENPDGTLVETGNAVQQSNAIDWLYIATAKNTTVAGDKIMIRASDKPGNIKEHAQVL